MSDKQAAVWQSHSGQWALVDAPLRPSPSDGALMLDLLGPTFERTPAGAQVAMLGVTPEVVQLNWPDGTRLQAFDCSEGMLEAVWAPHGRISSSASLARWQALPGPSAQFDAVVGDGALNALPTYDEYRAVLRELWRVTRASASVVIRCFVRPGIPGTIALLREELNAGAIGSFHALKWRLAMLLAARHDGIVSVRAIYEVFEQEFDRQELARVTGWLPGVIDTIDAYRAMPTIYSFPTISQIIAVCDDLWEMDALSTADYELANCCPTLRLSRISDRCQFP